MVCANCGAAVRGPHVGPDEHVELTKLPEGLVVRENIDGSITVTKTGWRRWEWAWTWLVAVGWVAVGWALVHFYAPNDPAHRFAGTVIGLRWLMHFHLSRDPSQAAQLTGVVRLDGRPLPRALIAFHLAEGREFAAYAVAETDEAGRYAVHDLTARSFRVTVAADEAAAVPPEYGNPARTPLEYTPDRLGPVTRDFELRSFRGGPAPTE
jgi:hypothetical protein